MIDNLIRAATCHILCGNESGTGYLVADSKVLTARHCVLGAIKSQELITLTFSSQEGDITFSATIFAQSEEMDTCILSLPQSLGHKPILLNSEMPQEGGDWRSFGYPLDKTSVGHRIAGTISHLLDSPKLKIDIDLSIEPSTSLENYGGFSGAAVVCEGASRGMIRLRLDGTLGAISIYRLSKFLLENGIQLQQINNDTEGCEESRGNLAGRRNFQKTFEQIIAGNPGEYVFLEGAHGIGKTTFCNEFEPEDGSLFILGTYSIVSQGRGPGAIYRTQPEVFFNWLSTAVSNLITGRDSRKEERNYVTLVRETSALLEAFSQYCNSTNRRGILFLDGLNEAQAAAPETLRKLLGLLPQSLPQSVTIILTAPNYHNVAALLTGRVKSQNIISLPPLSEQASSNYCWQELTKAIATSALIAGICKKAQGHPLYLRYLIEYANNNLEDVSLDIFPILTGTIEQYYESLWPMLLDDADAVQLLAIMARLRWGIETNDLLKILMPTEQKMFIPTMNRIRHLLLTPDATTIYHPSFTEFLTLKTADLEAVVQKRLSEFCINETQLEYCTLNVVFHLLRSDAVARTQAVSTCNQTWVDDCVALGVEPDTLLFDIEKTLSTAIELGPPVEVFRLLLLSQRVNFRYNTIFAQSARLVAEALIALEKPQEALKHVIRFNTLIVAPDEALQIAFRLIQHEYRDEALDVLELLHQRILEAYKFDQIELQEFLDISRFHIRTFLFIRLAEGGGMMRHINSVIRNSVRVLRITLTEKPPEVLRQSITQITCLTPCYFLCFQDVYTPLAVLKEKYPEEKMSPEFLQQIIWTLFECVNAITEHNLPNDIESLSQVFSDIDVLVKAGASLDKRFNPVILDTLIQLGAPSSVVLLFANTGEEHIPQPLTIRADNNVDVDFSSIFKGAEEWRTMAFLNSDFDCPLVGSFNKADWLLSLDLLISALYWCEGKARRALADGNESLRLKTLEYFKARVLKPLTFELAQRVSWDKSYAIPENLFPLIYEQISVVLTQCFSEHLPDFLQNLSKRVDGQFGLYTEGFREAMFLVLQKLTIRELEPSLSDKVFELLQQLKEYVILGVENRHELVPEILKLIPLFVKVGANEVAEELYRHMLGVSMGPTWYKEDQLGLMVSAISKMPQTYNVQKILPQVAGYLERASGEMTFQRFVRYEKHTLLGELFRRGKFKNGGQYFKRETCGSTADLISECKHGAIDKVSPTVGMRHPGTALDEQHAILKMVQNAEGLEWRLLWSLLEIFQCGDERHLGDYAKEYARLINEHGIDDATIFEMVNRVGFVVGAEIDPEERQRFLISFNKELDISHHQAFSSILSPVSDEDSKPEEKTPVANISAEASKQKRGNSLDEDFMYMPGVFGQQSAMREADAELEIASTHLKRRNLAAAKLQAVKVLRILQEGGWSIWGNLSEGATRAISILREEEDNAATVLGLYAPLLEGERHESQWRLAEHLITKVADLLSEDERSQLLQSVIDHVHLMVGDASSEIETFKFLDEEAESNPSMELFNLVLWLLDHPHWLRRDKAAGMVVWLVESDSIYFEAAVKEAFSMVKGYSPDILCGVLDEMSTGQPSHIWDRIYALLDLEEVLQNCRHIGRLVVLHRIAERAKNAGSSTGSEVASRVSGLFLSGAILLSETESPTFDPPYWASCISKYWRILDQLGLLTRELISCTEEKLTEICAPLDVHEAWQLENAVSVSFRQGPSRNLNRWEAKVRYALNTAIFPYVSKRNFRQIESVLRVFNPSLPEKTLIPGYSSSADAINKAISTGINYADAIGDSDLYFLDYYEMTEGSEDDRMQFLEILAVVVPIAYVKQAGTTPTINTAFRSRELPDLNSVDSSHETCWRLLPETALFGSLTPAFPLPTFAELIKAEESDFVRVNWRNGRTNNVLYSGRPKQEGCLLAVKRKAVRLPEEKKMAWIILKDGVIVTMIDSLNNQLI